MRKKIVSLIGVSLIAVFSIFNMARADFLSGGEEEVNSYSYSNDASTSSSSSGSGWDVDSLEEFNLPKASSGISGVIEEVAYWLLAILGIFGVIGFIISGLIYLTAAGDEDQAKRAKKTMMYSIIGVIVGLSGVVIIRAVDAALNGSVYF